ncbi:hypothetical protein VB002_13545 [Campylobacter concisus]
MRQKQSKTRALKANLSIKENLKHSEILKPEPTKKSEVEPSNKAKKQIYSEKPQKESAKKMTLLLCHLLQIAA